MKSSKFIQGPTTYGFQIIHTKEPKRRDYGLTRFTNNVPIARVYYHPAAKQFVIDPVDVALTKKTILELLPFLDPKRFRRMRRAFQSYQKRGFRGAR